MRHYLNAWLPGLLLALIGIERPWLEASMMHHMALELPALFACGWLAAHVAGPACARRLSAAGWSAVPALLLAWFATGYWMLPVALDQAVLDPAVNLCKVASLVLAGWSAGTAWRAAGLVLQAFFMLNWAWMTLTAGLLYQDAPQQLCSVYLSDQQGPAGVALVVLVVAVLGFWLPHAALDRGAIHKKSPVAT